MPETGPQPGATAIIDRETAADEADFIEADDLYGDEETTASPVNEFTVMTEPDPDDFGSEKESEPDNHTSAEYELRDGELYPSASNEDDGTQAGLAISHWMNEAQHAEYQEAIATAMDGGEGLIETLSPVGHTDDTEQFVVMTYRFVRFTDDGTPVIEISSHTIDRPRETPLQLEDQDQINDDYITNEVDEASLDEAAVTPSLEPRPFDQDTPISEATTNASTPSDEPGQSEIIESTATVPESTATTPESPEAEAGTNITRSEYILRNETLTPAKAGEDGTDATLDVAHWMNPEQRTIHEEALSQALNGGEGIMEMRGVIGHTDTEEVFVVATYRHVRNDADGSPVIEVTSMDVKRPVSTPPEEAGIPEPEAQHDGEDTNEDTTDDYVDAPAAVQEASVNETALNRDPATPTLSEPVNAPTEPEDEQDPLAAAIPTQPATAPTPPDAPGGGTLTPPAEQTSTVAEEQHDSAESGGEADDVTDATSTVQAAATVNPNPVDQSEAVLPSAEQADTRIIDAVSAPASETRPEPAQTREANPTTPLTEQMATQSESVKTAHDDEISSLDASHEAVADNNVDQDEATHDEIVDAASSFIPTASSVHTADIDTLTQAEATILEPVKATQPAKPVLAAATIPTPNAPEQSPVAAGAGAEANVVDDKADPPNQAATATSPRPVTQNDVTPAAAEQITEITFDGGVDTASAIPVEASVRTDTPGETAASVGPAEPAEKAPILNTPEQPSIAVGTIVETADEAAELSQDKSTSSVEDDIAAPTITEAGPATPVAEQIAAAESAPIAPLAAEAVLTAPAETAAGKVQVEENGSNRAEDDPAEEAAMEPVKSKVVTTAPPTTIEGDWLADFGAAPAETTTDDSWRDELKQPGIMTGPTLETTRNRTTISISDDTDEDDIVINFGAKPSSGRTRHRHNAGSVAA